MTTHGDGFDRQKGDYVVPVPRITDALGKSLRCAYSTPLLVDDEFTDLLRRLDLAR